MRWYEQAGARYGMDGDHLAVSVHAVGGGWVALASRRVDVGPGLRRDGPTAPEPIPGGPWATAEAAQAAAERHAAAS